MHSGRLSKASQRWVAVAHENALQLNHAHEHGTERIERFWKPQRACAVIERMQDDADAANELRRSQCGREQKDEAA